MECGHELLAKPMLLPSLMTAVSHEAELRDGGGRGVLLGVALPISSDSKGPHLQGRDEPGIKPPGRNKENKQS